ncbi:HIT domain-containing protein [Pseudocolwellia sp. HL-MZ19]|uniref:HIT domain-containing protein n=1 Tax=unclassified Pseudocolwellia TaxID=2848178 RepID=UPI003CEB7882
MSNEFQLHDMLVKDCIEVFELPLCKVLLMNDSQYPWFILVPKVNDVLDLYQLDWEQQVQFLNESSLLSEILIELFKGTKLNVAALGNMCPQLHVHHIVRFKNDIAWPKPVWGEFPAIPYDHKHLDKIISDVKAALDKVTS